MTKLNTDFEIIEKREVVELDDVDYDFDTNDAIVIKDIGYKDISEKFKEKPSDGYHYFRQAEIYPARAYELDGKQVELFEVDIWNTYDGNTYLFRSLDEAKAFLAYEKAMHDQTTLDDDVDKLEAELNEVFDPIEITVDVERRDEKFTFSAKIYGDKNFRCKDIGTLTNEFGFVVWTKEAVLEEYEIEEIFQGIKVGIEFYADDFDDDDKERATEIMKKVKENIKKKYPDIK